MPLNLKNLFSSAYARKGMTMNAVNIIGRLVRDPDMNRAGNGQVVCNLRIAIDDVFSKENRADFINATVFGKQAEVCERYLRKGYLAGVSGRIRTDAYTDADGARRYPVKIIADRVQLLSWPQHVERPEDEKDEPANDDAGPGQAGAQ